MFFPISKIIGAIISPLTFLTLLIAFSALARRFLPDGRIKRLMKWVGTTAIVLLLSLAVLPLGQYALTPLENKHVGVKIPRDIDGIIVISGDENPGVSEARRIPVLGHASMRYLYLKRLAKAYPKVPIVFAGNTRPFFPSKRLTTKQVIQPVVDSIGIPRWRTRYEEKSRNTHENALFSAQMVKPKKGEKWVIVTSAFHMPRSVLCFEKVGWTVIPAPADYFTYGNYDFHLGLDMGRQVRLLEIAAHEYYGLIAYWLMGWIEKPW